MSLSFIGSFSFARLCAAVLLGCLSLPHAASAQRSLIDRADPAVEQTVLRAERNAKEFGKSVSALTRMGEIEKVEQLLGSMGRRGYNDAQKIQIASELSSSERLQLVRHPKISSASVKIIDGMFDLRAKQLEAPDRLGKAIEALLAPNPDQSLPAIRILFQGGEASVAALAQSIVNTNDAGKRDVWIRALLRIDEPSGVDALRRLALYGNPQARSGALAALIRLNPDRYPTEMMTALHRADAGSTQAAEMVSKALTRNGESLPSRSAVVAELRHQLEEASRVAANGVREFGRAKVWVVSAKRGSVKHQRLPEWTRLFREAADAAARLVAVGDNRLDSMVQQAIAGIAYEVANDPDWGDPDQLKAFFSQRIEPSLVAPSGDMVGLSTSQFILQALRVAIDSDNDPAALGLIRLVAGQDDSPTDWVTGSGRNVSPLVMAIDHPNSVIRYEAASVIAGMQITSPYAGSSRVRDRWKQMSRLGDRGAAIVLENRPEVIAVWERLMNQAGLDPVFASTARQLEVFASTGDDIRLIISKRSPKDVSAVQLIDMVRRIRMTRDVPVLFYSDPALQSEAPEPEVIAEEMNAVEAQAAADEAATVPDKFGIIGGIENIQGVVEKDLLYGDLDIDSTTRRELDLQVVGMSRWQDESLRAGLIRQIVRPRSVAGLYEILRESRTRQHLPPLSPIDRTMFREIAVNALAN